jgi:hypothetical protein
MIDVVERTADACFMPLTVGGGVRTPDDMVAMLKAGADKVEQMRADDRTAINRAERGDGAAVAHEATKAGMRRQDQILTREVERVVEKAVYRDVCIDADGLRILAADIASRRAASEPTPAVPPASDARRR